MTENNLDNDSAKSFSRRIQKLDEILSNLEVDSSTGQNNLQRWRLALGTLTDLRSSFSLPISCIGPVKSGKSTLINTLAGADLLPTGAGITTSFPTTVSAGHKFSAHIQLQPKNTIDENFSKASKLLFCDDLGDRQISLFENTDRLLIADLLNHYQQTGRLTQHGIFNESYRLLRNLTNGAEIVAEHYQKDHLDFTITDSDDQHYRSFIRDETLSPYLLGIEIKAPLEMLPQYLALRDLPGLDTPNPSHQSIIVQQLSESPALIYVISSRIGLRQADYQLIEHLRELGLEDRLLFVINLDLDEHQNKSEMQSIITRCSDELQELGFTQPLYAFSVLALFWSKAEILDQLNMACQLRFKRWQEEYEKLSFSSLGAEQFLNRLQDLGRNRATAALLQHSEKRLQQIIGNTIRSVKAQLGALLGDDDTINSDLKRQHAKRQKIDALIKEAERMVGGVCADIEKYSYAKVSAWLNDKGRDSLHNHLTQTIANYQPPLQLIPEKNRNPLTPVNIIDNHFELTIPPKLCERVVIETINFMSGLHLEINKRLLDGCAPLFIICENLIDTDCSLQEELPLPIKISGEIPEFKMKSDAEERFAFVDRIRDVVTLWSTKLIHIRRQRSLAEEYALQIKKTTHKELSRWLVNYREQLKYSFLHLHLKECRNLINSFFTDFLTSTEIALENSEKIAGSSQQTTSRKIKELRKIESQLEELINP